MEFIQTYVTGEIIISIIIIVIAAILIATISKLYRKIQLSSIDTKHLENTTFHFAYSSLKVVIAIFAVVLILQVNGFNISAMVTGLGLASAIIGLALQDAVKDIITGGQIMVDKFFEVGDVVKFNGVEGVVVSFSVRTTKIKSIINENTYVVSNRNISAIEVVSTQCDIPLSLPYELPFSEAKRVLEKIVDRISSHEKVIDCNFKGTCEFASSSIDYLIRLHVNPEDRPQTRRDSLVIIQKTLEENGISIPYTQIDIHNKL